MSHLKHPKSHWYWSHERWACSEWRNASESEKKKKTAINCLDVASIHFRLETSPASQVVPRFNQKHNGRKDSKKLRNPLCNGEHFIQLRSIGALASLGTCPCFQQLFCWGKSHDEWKSRFRNTGVSAVSIIQSSAINESLIDLSWFHPCLPCAHDQQKTSQATLSVPKYSMLWRPWSICFTRLKIQVATKPAP